MKVTIEFDEDSEQEDIQSALNGWKWKLAMFDLDQEIRSIVKHGYIGSREATECEIEAYINCRNMIRTIMSNNSLSFDI